MLNSVVMLKADKSKLIPFAAGLVTKMQNGLVYAEKYAGDWINGWYKEEELEIVSRAGEAKPYETEG